MDEYRKVSGQFLQALKTGELSEATRLVKNAENDLILCFRNGYVNVYYMSHSFEKLFVFTTAEAGNWTRNCRSEDCKSKNQKAFQSLSECEKLFLEWE